MQFFAPKQPTALVVGGGHIGTYLACKIAAGQKVTLKTGSSGNNKGPVDALCREAGVEKIASYEMMANKSVDMAFICTKTYSLAAVAAEWAQFGVEAKVVVLIHNGIFKSPFTAPSVAVVVPQGYDFVQTQSTASGWTIHVRNEEKPWIMPDTPEAVRVAKFLNSLGVLAVADPEYPYLLLRKYFINGVANLLSIVTNSNCNELLANHKGRMELLYQEMMDVLRIPHKEGIDKMPADFHEVVFNGLASYGSHYPSSKHDFDKGMLIEVDSLNGYICMRASEQGIWVPENAKLVQQVKDMCKARDLEGPSAIGDQLGDLPKTLGNVLTVMAAVKVALAVASSIMKRS